MMTMDSNKSTPVLEIFRDIGTVVTGVWLIN